jgi:hypothetical protein
MPLKLRAYSGRENGLMIIGSAAELNQLGTQLLGASDPHPGPVIPNWPATVASPAVTGPYSNVKDFQLSFHVSESDELPPSLKITRRGAPPLFILIVSVCALVGVVALLGEIIALVL